MLNPRTIIFAKSGGMSNMLAIEYVLHKETNYFLPIGCKLLCFLQHNLYPATKNAGYRRIFLFNTLITLTLFL